MGQDAGKAVVRRGESRGVSIRYKARNNGCSTLTGLAQLVNDVGVGGDFGGGLLLLLCLFDRRGGCGLLPVRRIYA